MKVTTHSLPEEFDEIQILALADMHNGDPHSNYKKILEYIDYIDNTPNCYFLLNGDVCDCAIKTSIGDIYGSNLQPMAQLEQAVKLFGKIAPKCLCIDPGNHENRIYKNDGLDLTQIMATQLGIADRYSPTSSFLFIRFGQIHDDHPRKACFTMYCVHGAGGGRMEGGKINRLMQLASIVDADIYVHSNTHLPAIVKNSYFRVSAFNSSVKQVDKLFVNTGSTLDYGGYGEIQCYKPNSIETPMIILNASKHTAKAIL